MGEITDYRLYVLDRHGKILSAEWLSAGDDEQALASARVRTGCSDGELWMRDRLVANISGQPTA